jgi:hypothetical protein
MRSALAFLIASALTPSAFCARLVPVAAVGAAPGAGGCQAGWEPTFGMHPGLPGGVRALTTFDAGQGPELVLSGFEIATWNGTRWTEIAPGQDLLAKALCPYDDGTGTALYACGDFSTLDGVVASRIARWDGVSWSSLGTGLSQSGNAMVVHDDGSGPALYAGGSFSGAGGVPALRVARWDGTSWAAVGAGIVGAGIGTTVNALAVFDDGSGPALYAGGAVSIANGPFANHVARWDGTSWAAVGAGTDAPVNALTVFDDGSGPALYAGGSFTTAGGMPAARVASWNGTAWSAVGNLSSSTASGTGVFTLAGIDLGNGPALYAGGKFQITSTTLHGGSVNRCKIDTL